MPDRWNIVNNEMSRKKEREDKERHKLKDKFGQREKRRRKNDLRKWEGFHVF